MKHNFRTGNYLFWIFIALFIKGIFFWLQVGLNYNINQPLLGFFTNDSHEYYDSMNNFYENGTYTPDVRMPGLGIIFLFFRSFFERNNVLDIILILQWLVSSVAIYTLSVTISRLIKKEAVFYFVFFLIILTHYVFLWDVLLLTESFCISFFIFSIYYLKRFLDVPEKKFLFLTGLFLTWCVFLRPVFFLFYGLLAIFLLVYFIKRKTGIRKLIIYGVLFLSLFGILDSIWIARNYKVKNKFIFLNDIDAYSKLNPNDPLPAVYLFLEAWGGDLENERHWFEMDKELDYRYRDTTLPNYIFTSQFNRDSLLIVKNRLRNYKLYRRDSIVGLINTSLQNYTHSIRAEKPFLYYIGAGFINYKKMLLSGYCNYDVFNKDFPELSLLRKTYRLTRAILFYLLFFTGLIYSVVYLFSKHKDPLLKVLVVIAHVNLFYISFFFRTAEFRYVLPSTVVFFCFTALVLDKCWDKIKGRSISAKQ